MQRINTSTKSTDLFGAGKHGFKDGNQGLGIAPTDLEAAWFNQVQEEIANVIEGTGTALDAGNRAQLLASIKSLAVEAGSKTVWFQAAAPIGWTQVTTHNNKAMRVVSGVGGGAGGSVAFTSAFALQAVSGTVGNTTLTSAQIPSHTHNLALSHNENGSGFATEGSDTTGSPTATTDGGTGGGSSHTHSFTGAAINLAVQYIDMILASKD